MTTDSQTTRVKSRTSEPQANHIHLLISFLRVFVLNRTSVDAGTHQYVRRPAVMCRCRVYYAYNANLVFRSAGRTVPAGLIASNSITVSPELLQSQSWLLGFQVESGSSAATCRVSSAPADFHYRLPSIESSLNSPHCAVAAGSTCMETTWTHVHVRYMLSSVRLSSDCRLSVMLLRHT